MVLTEDNNKETDAEFTRKSLIAESKLKRILLFFLGTVFLSLGIIGIALPILPTTPFLLLSAACYVRCSEKAYNWLIHNRVFGKIIRDYRDGKGLPYKVKAVTIILLWITILISMLFIQIIWIQILLLVIACVVSIHVALIRPKQKVSNI